MKMSIKFASQCVMIGMLVLMSDATSARKLRGKDHRHGGHSQVIHKSHHHSEHHHTTRTGKVHPEVLRAISRHHTQHAHHQTHHQKGYNSHHHTQNTDNKNRSRQNTEEAHHEFQSRIVGGGDTAPGEFKFMVSWNGDCGGSLIHDQLVLTAAHCGGINGGVRIGSDQLNSGGVTRGVQSKVGHPNYNAATTDNDYMILKLSQPVDISQYPPIQLNNIASKPSTNDELTVIGFGATSEGGAGSDRLQKVQVPANSHEQCSSQYSGIKQNIHLCAGFTSGGKDSCQGDSGGPLVKKIIHDDDTETHIHVGVVSWGYSCAAPNYPGVYARTSQRADWIQEAMCDLGSVAESCNTPEPTCDGVLMNVTLTTDAYGRETAWSLTDKASGNAITSRQYYVNYFDSWTSECIPNDKCYSMEFTDGFGDGMCTNQGGCGNYRVTIDGQEIFTGDGRFGKSKTESFCVGTPPPPSEEPTSAPTSAPSSAPTVLECDGNTHLHYTIQVQTDSFGGDTSIYTYKKDEENPVHIYTKDNFSSKTLHTLPAEGEDSLCLEPDTCYIFAIGDSWGDGLTYGEDGWFKGFLGGEEVFSGDAEFGDYAEREFCTQKSTLASPTDAPTQNPTGTPSASPTQTPTTQEPTGEPSIGPTNAPTATPSASPTGTPSGTPTKAPTTTPSASPTQSPTKEPTKAPTTAPSASPSQAPSTSPSRAPSTAPSASSAPTASPTTPAPTASLAPSGAPSVSPSTQSPSSSPSKQTCSLQDDEEWRFKNRSRLKCTIYIRGKKQVNLAKKCNKTWNGQKVHEACPETCGKRAGVGQCDFLRAQFKKARQQARSQANEATAAAEVGESARVWQNIFVKEDLAVEEKKNFLRR